MVQHFDSTESHRTAVLGDGSGILGDGFAVPEFSYAQNTKRLNVVPFRPTEQEIAETFRYRVIKRAIDLVLVLLAAPLLLPVFALVALIVWINCPGPVLFSHRRIRRNNSFFPMWKFRTMCRNSAEVLEDHLSAEPAARAEWHLTTQTSQRSTRYQDGKVSATVQR